MRIGAAGRCQLAIGAYSARSRGRDRAVRADGQDPATCRGGPCPARAFSMAEAGLLPDRRRPDRLTLQGALQHRALSQPVSVSACCQADSARCNRALSALPRSRGRVINIFYSSLLITKGTEKTNYGPALSKLLRRSLAVRCRLAHAGLRSSRQPAPRVSL